MNLTARELSLMGLKSGFLGGVSGGLITGLLFGLLLPLQGVLNPQNFQVASSSLLETWRTWGGELVVMAILVLMGLSILIGLSAGIVMGILGGALSGMVIAQVRIPLSQNWLLVGAGIGGILGLTTALLFLVDDFSWLTGDGSAAFAETVNLVYIFLAGGIMGGVNWWLEV